MTNETKNENNPGVGGRLKRLVMFFRRHFQCRFGTHWNMKYNSDIGRCLDCGYRTEEIEYPKPPPYKPAKCESCRNGYDGTRSNGYQPCGCPHQPKLNPVPPPKT